ncbi:MAG: hypothetical protein PUC26_04330 [Eubacteriales bacterium]|nr:hypothetical protein [Eubacteriales bacterium]
MDRKGTAMVEAAIVLPMVIAAVAVTILLLSFMMREAASWAGLHLAVNAAMGEKTKTQIHYDHLPSKEISRGWRNGHQCHRAEETLHFSCRVVMQGKKESRKECTVYDVNEKRYIRNVDLLRTWKDSGQENGDEK